MKKHSLLLFFLIGFIYCFVIKNILQLSSYRGDDFLHIISNPSIDEELWFVVLLSYLLTIKVLFKNIHAQVIRRLKAYKKLNQFFEIYSKFRKSKMFKLLNRGLFIIFILFLWATFPLDNPYLIDAKEFIWLFWLLNLYITVLFYILVFRKNTFIKLKY